MPTMATRTPRDQVATIANGTQLSNAITFGKDAMGIIQPRTAPASASLQFYGAAKTGGTYSPIKDENNAALAAINWDTTNHIVIPAEAAKYPYLKIHTNIVETAELVIDVFTKS